MSALLLRSRALLRASVCFASSAGVAMLAACAMAVPVVPADMRPLSAPVSDVVVGSDLPVRLPTGYTRTIPQQSRWKAMGTLPQGIVYQPLNTVFAIEGRQVHEAYLVVLQGRLQGFYLPAESHYSPLPEPISLPPEKGTQR
jgi:hypothetical protein